MIKKLKKIKNNIPDAVREYVNEHCTGRCQFVSYLEKFEDEVLQRVFAFKQPKGKELLITECLRRVSGYSIYLMRNLYFTMLAGYQAIFKPKSNYFIDESDFDVWFDLDDNYFKVGHAVINPGLLKETKYKYCNFNGQDYLMDYLNTYNEYPNLELLSKLGIRTSKSLLQKAMKDKQFCKFLCVNKEQINVYGAKVTITAYTRKLSIEDANIYLELGRRIHELKGTDIDRIKLNKYLCENKIGYDLYDDYLKAIKYLNLDLNDTKNTYPKEFMVMHDLRTQEYGAAKDREDAKLNRAFNNKFKRVSKKYSILNLSGKYIISIVKDITDLKREGRLLHHCVGRMGYDKKMVEKKSLIFCVRLKESPEIPFVTMEYSLSNKKILQIYGDHNSKPSDDVLNFVNNKWLKFAKKQLVTVEAA